MEDKYLQDSLIRLKEEAVKKKADAKKREEKIKELDKELGKDEDTTPKSVSETLGN